MKGVVHSLLVLTLALVGRVDASAIPNDILEERDQYKPAPPAYSTSTTSTTTTTTSTTSTTGTDYDTLTTTAYVTPKCSGTITWVTTVVTAFSTYTVGTTYYNEQVSLKYYVSGTVTYSTDSERFTSVTYVPGSPGPGPKTATAPTTARQINTLPRPCVAIMLTKTVSYEPEVQTQVYLRKTVENVFAWTATTGTSTVKEIETESFEVTVDVYTGTTDTLPYTQHSLATLHLPDAPPEDTSSATPTPTVTEMEVAAATTTVAEIETVAAASATGAAATRAASGVGVALAMIVVGVLGL